MSANVASQWGWYQISGVAVVAKTATVSLAAGVAVGVKTVGLVASTGTGKEITGALVAAVASAATGRTTVQVVVNRPRMQGRIT
jgi:predicted ribonuclease YlaK